MYSYCTLFDSNYLTRGLAMYESLKQYSADFHLYIFAFDDKSLNLLQKLDLECVTVITLKEFEDEVLLKVKEDRSAGEYCWTCTPSTIKYCIEKYHLSSCTYLDADLYFYSDPSVLIEEMGKKSVLITPHRYTPEYDQSVTSGIYCVQFMTFKNDVKGMRVLNWWRDACNAWCYAKCEDGKFGDQKYLDDWTERFEGIHVLQHKGGGVAPWNVQQYRCMKKNSHYVGEVIEDHEHFECVFYHFHALKFLNRNTVDLGPYHLNKIIRQTIYKPYIEHLFRIAEMIESYGMSVSFKEREYTKLTDWKSMIKIPISLYKKRYNVLSIDRLMEA